MERTVKFISRLLFLTLLGYSVWLAWANEYGQACYILLIAFLFKEPKKQFKKKQSNNQTIKTMEKEEKSGLIIDTYYNKVESRTYSIGRFSVPIEGHMTPEDWCLIAEKLQEFADELAKNKLIK